MRACADALTVMQGNSKLLMVAATAPDARAALGDVLSRTKVLFALSAGHGSAVASVSVWDDRWQVDHLVASPEVIDFGVAASAETGLMRHISEQAGELDIVLSDSARECLLSLDEKYSDSTMRVTYGIGDCVSASRDVALSDVAALLSGRLQLDTL